MHYSDGIPVKAPREKGTGDTKCRTVLAASGNVSNRNTLQTVNAMNKCRHGDFADLLPA